MQNWRGHLIRTIKPWDLHDCVVWKLLFHIIDRSVWGMDIDMQHGQDMLYRRESNLAMLSSPVTNNDVQFIYWAYCYHVKNKKISRSAPGLSVMTLRE
jgi:hypothetical protein